MEYPITNEFKVTEKQSAILINLARHSIELITKNNEIYQPNDQEKEIINPWGAFVTLKLEKKLRGCIGQVESKEPLWKTVRDMAIAAATGDNRFVPATTKELPILDIEISIVSPLVKINNWREIILGTHGVMIKKGKHSGIFLPQVAEETGWDLKTFLTNLCIEKASLNANCWLEKDTQIYIFTCQTLK